MTEQARRQRKNSIHQLADDEGSIAPLAIGLASILLAATFTFINAGSLLLFQERQTQLAEALALAVDEELTPDELKAAAQDGSALEQAAASFANLAEVANFAVETPDGLTVIAKVCAKFQAPVLVALVNPFDGAAFENTVCASAKARRIFTSQ